MSEQQCLWCGGYCVGGMEGVCRDCWEKYQFSEQEQPPTDMDIIDDLQRQVNQLKAENERLKKRAESAEKALWNIVYYVPGVGERDYSDKLIRIAETAVGIERY